MAFLKAFNPHELPPDVVLAVATGREEQLARILSVVRDNLSAPVKQHIIVSAPRGYGKSFFLRYIQVKIAEIAKEDGLPLAMALLSEELPHVKEADTLIAEIKRTFLQEPAESVGVRWAEDDGSAWDEIVAGLDRAIEERFGDGLGLLIAGVENFDLLVKKAFAKAAPSGRLREFLTRHGNRVMLLASSSRGAIDRDYDKPLFKVFEEVALQPWTIEQTVEFLIAQRKAANKPPLTDAQVGKAKAVATYISGTPRLATLIGEALLEGDPLGAADVLEKLVDELTPYYKERVEILPARSQVLLDALLRGGENCSATELAKRVGAPNQAAIAAPLDDLKKDLIVVGEKAPESAEVLHRVADRVFSHYYRKRILSHGLEICPLEALVDILALIYSPEEKRLAAEKFATRGLAREAAVMVRLWEADQKSTVPEPSQQMAVPSSEFDGLLAEWYSTANRREFENSLLVLESALVVARGNNNAQQEAQALLSAAWTLGRLGRIERALATAHEAASKAADAGNIHLQASGLRHAAWSLGILGRYDDAVATAQQAASKAADAGDIREQAIALRHAASSLAQLGRHDEALATAREAAAKAADAGDIVERLASLREIAFDLGQLGRHEEALAIAHEAIAKGTEAGDMHLALSLASAAWSLTRLNRRDEAIAPASEAFAMTERDGGVEERLAAAYVLLITRPSDAVMALTAYKLILNTGKNHQIFFHNIAHIATRHESWPSLIALLKAAPERATEIATDTYQTGEPGRLIAQTFTDSPHEKAFALARHFVAALAEAVNGESDTRLNRLWAAILDSSTRAIASKISNAQALRDFAAILATHPSVPAHAIALSDAAASYHAAGRDPRTLARLDPDLATMLTTVFPPKTIPQGTKRKTRRKKKR
jgi:tetratricopeptide (TPR) repeat protein